MSWLRNLLGLTTPEEKELQAMRKETAQLKEESNHIIYNAKKSRYHHIRSRNKC